MTIERFSFRPPLNVNTLSNFKLEDALLFAQRREIPPGYRINLTPPGYRDTYVLTTETVQREGYDDTIGYLEATMVKTGAKQGGRIDEHTPIGVVARPNVLDGGEGIRIDEVIRYISSQGGTNEGVENEAVEIPIPVEIPLAGSR